jgi:hypothetical protein
MLAAPHATLPYPDATDIKTCSTLAGEEGLRDMLLDQGMPENEASMYVEVVRRGEVVVVVETSDEQAAMVMDILNEPRTGDGYAGEMSGFARHAASFREHHRQTVTESGLTYMEYEPAYRYGYDVGTRYPDKDWAALEEGIRRGWELWHPATWERFKGAIRHGWNTCRAHF